MSPKRWLLLLTFYISYLMFGASIYYQIEHHQEQQSRAAEIQARTEINEYLTSHLVDKNITMQNSILEKISAYCNKPVTRYTDDEADIPYTWTFYHAFFFAFTVCSTVGYGNISPTTTLGRMIMIVYSVIGIPVNGILFAGLGEYFGLTFEAIYRRYKKYKLSTDLHYVPPKLSLITTVFIALVPGIALFLLLPSLIFSHFEDWPYTVSFYYTYVTTTTIGFGDYVPTFNKSQPRKFGALFVVYQVFVIVWFIFSLGYLLMIMTFITRFFEQKIIVKLSRQYKPVYNEPNFSWSLHRSNSCPELSMYRPEPLVLPARKRAFSESHDLVALRNGGATPMVHASSDTELAKYDRVKTFERAEAYRQTTDLLAKVVTALANVKPPPATSTEPGDSFGFGCYNGFSDSQILASEWSYPASINEQQPPRHLRARACSDFNLGPRQPAGRQPHNEWTWSGDNNQIQKAINKRYHRQAAPEDIDSLKKTIGGAAAATRTKKFSVPDGLRKLFPFKKRTSAEMSRKLSIASVPGEPSSPPIGLPPSMTHYSTVTANASAAFYPSSTSLNVVVEGNSGGGHTNLGFVDESEQASNGQAYPRRAAAAAQKRRRESLYTQNPTVGGVRRGSMFAQIQSRNNALAAATAPQASILAGPATRRDSLFPALAHGRRSSNFSVASDRDLDVLEQTTLADLIRALEVVHTHAAHADVERGRRPEASVNPTGLPALMTLFGGGSGEQRRLLAATAANRLYARRSTVVGTMPQPLPPPPLEPPPSYSEMPNVPAPTKFRRRFSVRPTALQIPPGQAPPPPPMPLPTQTALQRRLSLRPSPLARELSGGDSTATASGTSSAEPPTSKYPSRLMSLTGSSAAVGARPSTSSTHSPLSRIVQISQAQRKISMPERKPNDNNDEGQS